MNNEKALELARRLAKKMVFDGPGNLRMCRYNEILFKHIKRLTGIDDIETLGLWIAIIHLPESEQRETLNHTEH